MKTILVPTDFSDNADSALDYAIMLAGKEHAKIILLHAYFIVFVAPDVPPKYIMEQLADVKEDAKKKLLLRSERLNASGILHEVINKEDFTVKLILETANEQKVDMIIMGSKGAGGLTEKIIGSNTSNVMKKADCPVIAIPYKVKFSPVKNIVYATDFNESDFDAISHLVEIAKAFDAIITVLHISDEVNADVNDMKAQMNNFQSSLTEKVSYDKFEFKIHYGNDLVEALEAYIDKEAPELMAMSKSRKNFLESLFEGSATKEMIYHSKVPLLTFNYRSRAVQ